MKRNTLIATIAAGALVVGVGVGAAIAVSQDPAPETTIAATPTETAEHTPAGEPTVDESTPRIAGTPAPGADADAVFLAYVAQETPDWTPTKLPDMTDEQLIAAGHEACEQIAAGVDPVTLRLVEGEEPSPMGDYVDSSAIFNGGITAYCPELVEWPEG